MTAALHLERVVERLRAFVEARDWHQFHDPKNLAMAIASEAGELLSELRWVASADSDRILDDANARQRIENEIADIAISLILLCDRTGVDLLSAVDRKIDQNEVSYPIDMSKGRAERPN